MRRKVDVLYLIATINMFKVLLLDVFLIDFALSSLHLETVKICKNLNEKKEWNDDVIVVLFEWQYVERKRLQIIIYNTLSTFMLFAWVCGILLPLTSRNIAKDANNATTTQTRVRTLAHKQQQQ